MPRIQLLTTMAGPEGTKYPGTHDVDDAIADALVAGGYATRVVVEVPPTVTDAPESASVAPPETAVLERTRRKKG